MAGRTTFAALSAVLIAGILVQSTTAATYVVGGNLGWQVPTGGAATYANWASQITFLAGDILVFNFTTGAHDVARVAKDEFDSCNANSPITLQTVGPATITLNGIGEFNFICTFGRHCANGQKLSLNVTAATPPQPSPAPASPPPSTSPSPASPSPSPSGSPAPSPESSPSPSPEATTPSPSPFPPPSPAPTPEATTPPAPAPGSPEGSPPSPSPPTSASPPPSGSSPTTPGSFSPPPPPSSGPRNVAAVGFAGSFLAVAMGLIL